MGGSVGRYAVKNCLQEQVVHFVSLGTPNHGALYADWCGFIEIVGVCTEAVFDMRQKSEFLLNLNKDNETPPPTLYLTYRTPCDSSVSEESVPLRGASSVRVNLCDAKLELEKRYFWE